MNNVLLENILLYMTSRLVSQQQGSSLDELEPRHGELSQKLNFSCSLWRAWQYNNLLKNKFWFNLFMSKHTRTHILIQ